MQHQVINYNYLFEVTDVFGVHVHTTQSYWKKITTEKHRELTASEEVVKKTINKPEEVYRSVSDPFIKLFYTKINGHFLIVVIKYLGKEAFVVTAYETSKIKRKGEKLWPK